MQGKTDPEREIIVRYGGRNAAIQAKVTLEGISFWAGEQQLIALEPDEWEELEQLHRDLVFNLHPLSMYDVTNMANLMQQYGWTVNAGGSPVLVEVLNIGKLAASGGYVMRLRALNGTWDVSTWAEFRAFESDVRARLADQPRRPL